MISICLNGKIIQLVLMEFLLKSVRTFIWIILDSNIVYVAYHGYCVMLDLVDAKMLLETSSHNVTDNNYVMSWINYSLMLWIPYIPGLCGFHCSS